MVEYTIGPMEDGKKVHRLLRQLLPGVPLSGIHKMIRTGRIKANGRKVKPDDVVAEGDVLRLFMAQEDYEAVRKPKGKFGGVSRNVEIVYEDSRCLVVNKPAGLLTHGDKTEQKDTLVNRVLARLYDLNELIDSPFYPAPVHRLDRNTSGLVLFGKTPAVARELSEAIANGDIHKWYIAIVKGQAPEQGTIRATLDRSATGNRTVLAKGGKSAETRFWTVARSRSTCLVLIELVTGRTHQIRAHFERIGCPLWGDVKYGGAAPRSSTSSTSTRNAREELHQWLHAMWLQLPEGKLLTAPLPDPFLENVRKLGYSQRQIEDISRPPSTKGKGP